MKGRDVHCCADDMERMIEELRTYPLFAALPREVVRTLVGQGTQRGYRGGECLRGTERGNQIGVVLEGGVRVCLLSPDGRCLTLVNRARGELFELEGCSGNIADAAGATILEAGKQGCAVYCFDRAQFLQSVTATREGALELTTFLLERLHDQRQAIGELAFCDVATRVARTLGRLAKGSDQHIVWETHQELAARLGTEREEVSRAVAELRRRNLVTSPRRGQTIVLEPDELLRNTIPDR